MLRPRKKYLSAGLAGVLCSTALFGLTAAHADGKKQLAPPWHAGPAAHTRQFFYTHVSRASPLRSGDRCRA